MKIKLFELRDKATFIPIFAFRARAETDFTEQENYLFRRSGFSFENDCVILGRLECAGVARNATYDPFAWNDRTFTVAHQYIREHFDELPVGSVIDVEFILGESSAPKESEAVS